MFFKIKNTSGDRTKVTQHRSAAGFSPEPSIGGARLRVGQHMFVEPAHFERIRESLYKSFQDGAIEVEQVGDIPEGHQVGVPYDSPRPHPNLHGASGEAPEPRMPPAQQPEQNPVKTEKVEETEKIEETKPSDQPPPQPEQTAQGEQQPHGEPQPPPAPPASSQEEPHADHKKKRR